MCLLCVLVTAMGEILKVHGEEMEEPQAALWLLSEHMQPCDTSAPLCCAFCSLNCLFTNTMHIKVDFPACVLRPGGTVEVPITFCPREEASYHEFIPFEINGLCEQTVEVRGRGTEMKVRY